MTKERQFFWRMAVARLSLEVASLHFEAVREKEVFPAVWLECIDKEVQHFSDRIDREVISEGSAGREVSVAFGVAACPAGVAIRSQAGTEAS